MTATVNKITVRDGVTQVPEEVLKSIQQLDSWVERNGWAGYDPYDIQGHPLYLRLWNSAAPLAKVFKMTMGYSGALCPVLLRRVFRIRKEVNAKGMGLFARAYLDLYRTTGKEHYFSRAKEALDWLEKNPSKGYSGLGWGYPFDWQSFHFLRRETPSAVVTACVGDAFFTFYRLTGEARYLDICRRICDFFIGDLNIDNISSDKICFSYTPVDREHCHNANLFAAEFLIRVGREIKNEKYIECGMKSLNYTLGDQNEDGSFYYLGPEDKSLYNLPEKTMRHIDHYHTGFVLRCLHSIYQLTRDKELLSRIERCYHHYSQNLFDSKTIPKLTPEDKYPINIHSCAEAILCMSTLSDLFPDASEYAKIAFLWTKKNMQTREGWFIYMIMPTRVKGVEWKVRVPYIRWAQAWMLRALSQYYSLLNTGQNEADRC